MQISLSFSSPPHPQALTRMDAPEPGDAGDLSQGDGARPAPRRVSRPVQGLSRCCQAAVVRLMKRHSAAEPSLWPRPVCTGQGSGHRMKKQG